MMKFYDEIDVLSFSHSDFPGDPLPVDENNILSLNP